MKITILQRPGQFTAKEFKSNLQQALDTLTGELNASIKIEGFSKNGWPTIGVEGEDAEVLIEVVARSLGRAQTGRAEIELGGVYQGIIDGEQNDTLRVDVGTETPRHATIQIRLEALRAQLADGKAIPAEQITRDYCLFSGIAAKIRVSRLEPESDIIEGWFADSEISRLSNWIGSHLDRILVTDCFQHEVEAAIKRSRIERDIVSVEPLTLTAHSLVCKLGTDAVGLIPKLGSVLRRRELNPFVPKRILARCRPW